MSRRRHARRDVDDPFEVPVDSELHLLWEEEEEEEHEEDDAEVDVCGRCLARFEKDGRLSRGCSVVRLPQGCAGDDIRPVPTLAPRLSPPTWKAFYGSRFDGDRFFLAPRRAFPSPALTEAFARRVETEPYLKGVVEEAAAGEFTPTQICDECVEWLLSCGALGAEILTPGDCWPACCCECASPIDEPEDEALLRGDVDLRVVLATDFVWDADGPGWYDWRPDPGTPAGRQLCLRYASMQRLSHAIHDASRAEEIRERERSMRILLGKDERDWKHGPTSRLCVPCWKRFEEEGRLRRAVDPELGHVDIPR